MSCKKTECMIVTESDSSRWKLQIEDDSINQVQKYNSRGRVITDNGKCDKSPKVHWNSRKCLPWVKHYMN